MKQRLLALTRLALLFVARLASAHELDESWQWEAGAAVATGRVFRGQSQTDGDPAIVGEVKLIHSSGVYTGIWAGNADLGPRADTHAEIDYFIGWSRSYGPWSINTGYLYRERPSNTMSLDFQEVTASMSYNFGFARLGVGESYSWDYFQGGSSIYISANLRAPVAKLRSVKILALASVGHYDFSNPTIGDYSDLDLRVVAQYRSWEYSVGFSDTDVDPEHSGLLTRDRCGPQWRAQTLVMF